MFLTTKQIDVTGKAWSYVSVLVKPRRCNAIYDCQSLLRGHWTMIRKVQQHNDTLLLIDSKNIRRPLNQAGKKLFTNWMLSVFQLELLLVKIFLFGKLNVR